MGSHFWLNLIATTYILFKTFHFHCGLKMIRISVLLGLFLLVSGVLLPGIPQNFDDRDTDEEVAELLTDLFREAKDIDIENEVENPEIRELWRMMKNLKMMRKNLLKMTMRRELIDLVKLPKRRKIRIGKQRRVKEVKKKRKINPS